MKKISLSLALSVALLLTACQSQSVQQDTPAPTASLQNTASEAGQQEKILRLSNMGNEESLNYVKNILEKYLSEKSVNDFIQNVTEYNSAVEYQGLIGNFEERTQPEYDLEKLDQLWNSKKGDFIGTNCRLNTFTLLKNNVNIPAGEGDDWLLSFDRSAIQEGKVIEEDKIDQFIHFFSRVPTQATQDVKIHAQNMKKHFENIQFPEHVNMLSVVFHDNLEGDYLFIGHVGLLVQADEGYLFVEKLSFQEPYQAIQFKTKEEAYLYLFERYKHFSEGTTTAQPFILDNADLVLESLYKNGY